MYLLKMTEDDKNNLLKVIENGQFQGNQVEYVVLLKNKIINAPEEIVEEKEK